MSMTPEQIQAAISTILLTQFEQAAKAFAADPSVSNHVDLDKAMTAWARWNHPSFDQDRHAAEMANLGIGHFQNYILKLE